MTPTTESLETAREFLQKHFSGVGIEGSPEQEFALALDQAKEQERDREDERCVHFTHATGQPTEAEALYQLGDVRLVWVNQGDILQHGLEVSATRSTTPEPESPPEPGE